MTVAGAALQSLVALELGNQAHPELVRWSTLVPAAPPDFYGFHDAYALFTPEGPILIDPVMASPGVEAEVTSLLGQRPVATVLTSSWHERAAYEVRERYGTPVWLPAVGRAEADGQADHYYRHSDTLPGGLRPIGIADEFAGDHVLWWPAPSGERVLFTGDVFTGAVNSDDPRPGHWRRAQGTYLVLWRLHSQEEFTRRFRRLLGEDFDLVCPAHAPPLRGQPKTALRNVLARGRFWQAAGATGTTRMALIASGTHA